MLILLSPAKQLDFEPARPDLETTQPALLARTAELSKTTATLSRAKLRQLMDISDDLAELNVERFKAFDATNDDGKAAALAFAAASP